MSEFKVPGMNCGHCVASIESAVSEADPQASVSCDLAAKTVKVESAKPDAAIAEAIRAAGFEVSTPA